MKPQQRFVSTLTVPGVIFAGVVLLKIAGVGLAAAWSWWFVVGLGAIWLCARGFLRSTVLSGEAKRQAEEKVEAEQKLKDLFGK